MDGTFGIPMARLDGGGVSRVTVGPGLVEIIGVVTLRWWYGVLGILASSTVWFYRASAGDVYDCLARL